MGRKRTLPICTQYWKQGHRYDQAGLCKCGFNRNSMPAGKGTASRVLRIDGDLYQRLERLAADKGKSVRELAEQFLEAVTKDLEAF